MGNNKAVNLSVMEIDLVTADAMKSGDVLLISEKGLEIYVNVNDIKKTTDLKGVVTLSVNIMITYKYNVNFLKSKFEISEINIDADMIKLSNYKEQLKEHLLSNVKEFVGTANYKEEYQNLLDAYNESIINNEQLLNKYNHFFYDVVNNYVGEDQIDSKPYNENLLSETIKEVLEKNSDYGYNNELEKPQMNDYKEEHYKVYTDYISELEILN